MPRQVFISYSTEDSATVTTVRDQLEVQGFACWMAPRDIVPGEDYAEQIIEALESATVLVLVLSASSNRSRFVRNEVERAVTKDKTIIPFRIQEVQPSRSLEFFISNAQWIDGWAELAPSIDLLASAVRNHVEPTGQAKPAHVPRVELPAAVHAPSAHTVAPQSAEVAPPPLPAFLSAPAEEAARVQPPFVARGREIAQLESLFSQALQGEGQVVFVTGVAGSGKSTLIQEFVRQAQEKQPELVVAFGNCRAYAGIEDPYLPFREILGQLTGDVEQAYASGLLTQENARRLWNLLPTIGKALVDLGPSLVNTFVPGRPLVARATYFAGDAATWLARLQELAQTSTSAELERARLFGQFTELLQALAKVYPLILVLDDIQWADTSSISLLFHLGRALIGSRILIVGSYRPEDVALGRNGERHPLEDVVSELKRQRGEIAVHLSQKDERAGREFVNAFLDTQPHRLDKAFRETLFRHTGGHPLFTVELLRDLQARGILVKDAEGIWNITRAVEWEDLPAKVSGVIEKRIGWLDENTRTILAVASVEGAEFSVEVVARVQGVETRQLLRTLSQLEKRNRLVRAQGERQVNGRYLSRYRFAHALFQHYLYNELSPGERRLYHGEIAAALEEEYGEQSSEIAVQLARHYMEAGKGARAVPFLLQAGEQSNRVAANQEALAYYNQALALATASDRQELIRGRRAKVLVDLDRGIEAVGDYERLVEGARKSGNRSLELELTLQLMRAQYQTALDGQEPNAISKLRDQYASIHALARELDDPRSLVMALLSASYIADYLPELREQGHNDIRQAIVLSEELGDEELSLDARMLRPWVDNEVGRTEDTELLIEELQKRRDLVRLNVLYFRYMWQNYDIGNFARGVAVCDAGIELAATIGVLPVMYYTLRGICLLSLGQYGAAWSSLQLEIADDEHPFGRTFRDTGTAIYLLDVGEYAEAADLLAKVMVQARRLHRGWLEGWSGMLRVRALLAQAMPGALLGASVVEALAKVQAPEFRQLIRLKIEFLALNAEHAWLEGRYTDAEAYLQDVSAREMDEYAPYRPLLVRTHELKARVLLKLQKVEEALVLADAALQVATEMEYLPMLWRLWADKAEALAQSAQEPAAEQARQSAVTVVQQLAANIANPEHRRTFLAIPAVASLINLNPEHRGQ